MKASEIMTRRVITVARDASILDAVRLMLLNRISGLPVVDDSGKLVGMVTEGDFLRRAEMGTERRHPRWLAFLLGPGQLAEEYVHARGRKVEEVMSPEPHAVASTMPLDQIVRTMERHRVKRVPVVDDGTLVGIISRADLLHALAGLGHLPPASKDDMEIRDRILAELADKPWSPSRVNVVVRNGEVELSGVIVDERVRDAIKVAAENIRGVTVIHDHLVCVDPATEVVVYSPEDEAAARTAGRWVGGGKARLRRQDASCGRLRRPGTPPAKTPHRRSSLRPYPWFAGCPGPRPVRSPVEPFAGLPRQPADRSAYRPDMATDNSAPPAVMRQAGLAARSVEMNLYSVFERKSH